MSWKIEELDGEIVRDVINLRDRFNLQRTDLKEYERNYSGGMVFNARNGVDYLIKRSSRATGRRATSLGPRSPETEAKLAEFLAGRERLNDRIVGVKGEIEKRRRKIVAHGVTRLPFEVGKIIRKLDQTGWLGDRLHIVGTMALFAYEARASVRIDGGQMSTDDIDLLNDARRKISLAGAVSQGGLVGVLQQADKSFMQSRQAFRAVNDKGFLVDLIGPHGYDPMRVPEPEAGRIRMARKISNELGDLEQVGIDGLEWLINAPKFEGITFDSRGYPVPIPTVDPRAFAAHKLWVSQRKDRDPEKKRKDVEQAIIAAVIAEEHLDLSFDDPTLSSVPRELIDGIDTIRDRIDEAKGSPPGWGLF